jgi:2-dehydropantoate 2-reductase
LELPWLGGKVVALGRELGVPTPTHDVMYAALKPYAMARQPEPLVAPAPAR